MKFYEDFEEYDSRFLVCEFCNGGNLDSYLEKNKKKIGIEKSLHIIFEIAIGINFMHKNGLTHRDLKGDNILIHDGVHKIGDFGFSNDESLMESVLGTPLYMAPEIIQNDKKKYNNKVDIWALGVILYNMITGKYYFFAERRMQLYNRIVNKPYSTPKKFRSMWSPELQDLFGKCFEKKPDKRISIDDFLSHPVFAAIKSKYDEVLERIHTDIKKHGRSDQAGSSPSWKPRPNCRRASRRSSRRRKRSTAANIAARKTSSTRT